MVKSESKLTVRPNTRRKEYGQKKRVPTISRASHDKKTPLFHDDKTGNRTVNPYVLRFVMTTFQREIPIVAKRVSMKSGNSGNEDEKLRVLLTCRDHGKAISNLVRKRMAYQKIPQKYIKTEDDCTSCDILKRHNKKREEELASLRLKEPKIGKEKDDKRQSISKLREEFEQLRLLIQSKRETMAAQEQCNQFNPLQLLKNAKRRSHQIYSLASTTQNKDNKSKSDFDFRCYTPSSDEFGNQYPCKSQMTVLDLRQVNDGTMTNFIRNMASIHDP